MYVFYCRDITGTSALLSEEESAHCTRVLRLGKGERVLVTDGKGGMFEAEIITAETKGCRLGILKPFPVPQSRNFNLQVAIAPTKSMDRFEWFVEKAVEIGIDSITPLLCNRSERRILNTERLKKLVISTMKQAMVARMPVLNELVSLDKFLQQYNGPIENRMIAHCEESSRSEVKNVFIPGKDTIVLIGPEGDFTPHEIETAINRKFIPVTLGNNRLRTETAGIVVCSLLNA